MQSQGGASDKQDRSAEDAPSRGGSSAQRWGRGSATALERMKELERRHDQSGDKSDRGSQRAQGEG